MEKYEPTKIEPKWPRTTLTSPRGLRPRSRGASIRGKQEYKYSPGVIEEYWQRVWEKEGVYKPDLDTAKKPFYNLMMFPYPSAEGMHVGNMYAFTGSDIYGRFKRMQGYDVFEPIGLDGFGIHSENYAIKVGRHPKEQAKVSESNFYRQLKATGNAYDWSRTVETYDADYYKWTQWIFIQLFKKGLAYRKKSPVNFCPSCKTVLADEQVIDAKCERCSSIIEKRNLEQWFFKITDYADRLLDGLTQIDWTEKVKIAQRQWIGRSEGAIIRFKIDDLRFKNKDIEVYTVFPETIYGVTYMVLAPEHPFVNDIVSGKVSLARSHLARLKDYVECSKKKTEQERIAEGKEKTGVFTEFYCVNPVNNQKVPIWVADYVIAAYGTGAVMGVPGSDHRDFAFASKYKLPIIRVIAKTKDNLSEIDSEEEVLEEGILVNSGEFSGLSTPDPAREKIKDFLKENGYGERKNQYHLRDWLISRQRYWGPPIPMINCEKCDWQPVPEKDLPVLLPDVKDWKPHTSTSLSVKGPLANHPEFFNVVCPNCGGEAVRETDVSDTFLDSSWYFFRYISTEFNNRPFDKLRVNRWLPVNMYIGGAEHSVLHLLYVRFLTMVFYDLGLIDFNEPFPRFYAHGLLIKEGSKMSKSKGNVVVPDAYIKKYGADTLRTYLMFLGPFSQGGDFYDSSISGVYRFLGRVYKLVSGFDEKDHSQSQARSAKENVEPAGSQIDKKLHQTIRKVTSDMEALRFNTAISALMELVNTFYLHQNSLKRTDLEQMLIMLAPFAPHVTEELFQFLNSNLKSQISKFESIHTHAWPKYDPKLIEEKEVIIVVQINGKVRATVTSNPFDKLRTSKQQVTSQKEIEKKALENDRVKKYLEGKTVKKVVYVAGKIINFVVD